MSQEDAGPKCEYSFFSKGIPYSFLLTPVNHRADRWSVKVVGKDAAAPYSTVYRWTENPPKTETEAIGMACERIVENFPDAKAKTQKRLR